MSTDRRVQRHTMGETSKRRKIEVYSDSYANLALSKEKEGQLREAASYYLKAADILLVLCKDERLDYSTWARLSQKATNHHRRIKMLLANHRKVSNTRENLV